MFRNRFRKHPGPEPGHREPRRHAVSFTGRILMLIGLLTVLYLLITYVMMPVLAWLTRTVS